MKKIYKSYKFRIYPNSEQEILLVKHFGACRFVYNRFLNERKEKYLNERTLLNYYDNAKTLTDLKKDNYYSWLKEINSQSLQSSIRNLDTAYKRFFNKQNNFPKFKSKYDRQSFNIPQNVFIDDNRLLIPKFRKGIKIKVYRKLEGIPLFATISKSLTNKYYVSITYEVEYEPYKKTNSRIGIDTGIKDLAILSNGDKYENIKSLKTKLKKIKYESKQLSKKQKGSISRNKQRKKLVKIHEKITNTRKDYLHKVSTEIVKNHDIISVEDLSVKNIMKNHHLAQAMSDVSLGAFYTMLEYKSNWNDRQFVKIDRFFPSSKTCSKCGWIKQDLTLNIREWTCDSCCETHDRDLNAAKNILKQGLNILSGCGIQSDIKQKQGEASSLDESMKLEV
jgi:putative transposase